NHGQVERPTRQRDALHRLGELHRISGRSGEPKFKQSVTPRGSPPEHETLRAASHTAIAAPCRGSRKTWRPLPSVETARARRVPLTRRTAAAEPGKTRVLIPTC